MDLFVFVGISIDMLMGLIVRVTSKMFVTGLGFGCIGCSINGMVLVVWAVMGCLIRFFLLLLFC